MLTQVTASLIYPSWLHRRLRTDDGPYCVEIQGRCSYIYECLFQYPLQVLDTCYTPVLSAAGGSGGTFVYLSTSPNGITDPNVTPTLLLVAAGQVLYLNVLGRGLDADPFWAQAGISFKNPSLF